MPRLTRHSVLRIAKKRSILKARSTLERAVELNSKDLRAHYQLGLVYAKLGNKEAAQKMLARADELRGEQREQEIIVYKLVEVP